MHEAYRAAKLRLLNFLSLFRDLQKPTRFGGVGGGGSSRILFRVPKSRRDSVGGGGSSRNFPGSPKADAIRFARSQLSTPTFSDIRE